MDKQKQKTNPPKQGYTPQFQVRSGLSAGGDLQGCLEKLQYWRDQYQRMCGGG